MRRVKVPWATRYRTSRAIFGQALGLLRTQRDLWVFPILASLGLLLFLAGAILLAVKGFGPRDGSPLGMLPLLGIVLLAGYPIGLVVSLLNAALVHGLHERLEGRPGLPRDAWRAAASMFWPLAAFNLVAALVGGILQVVGILLDKLRLVPYLGRLVQTLGAFGWAVATFFVIPIIVVERERNVAKMVQGSVALVRKQWGKSVAGLITVTLVVMVPAFVFLFGTLALVLVALILAPSLLAPVLVAWVAGGAIVLLAAVAVGQSTTVAYQVALYRYARTGKVSGPFTKETLVDAWAPYQA